MIEVKHRQLRRTTPGSEADSVAAASSGERDPVASSEDENKQGGRLKASRGEGQEQSKLSESSRAAPGRAVWLQTSVDGWEEKVSLGVE